MSGYARAAGSCDHRHGNADAALAHHIASDRDVAQVWAPAGSDAGPRRVLDNVAGHRAVGFDGDAEPPAARSGAGPPRPDIAHEIAAHRAEPSAVIEIGDGDAVLRAVDHVVREDR